MEKRKILMLVTGIAIVIAGIIWYFSKTNIESVQSDIKKDSVPIGQSFEEDEGVKGQLVYTVDEVRLISDLNKSNIVWENIEKSTMSEYPECFQDNSLTKGFTLLVLEISVQNINATNIRSGYENKNVFRADMVGYVIDISKYDDNFLYYDLAYCSLPERAEHSYAYELQPGEETSFQIGYLVPEEKISEQLMFSSGIGDENGIFVSLGLGKQDEERN